MRRKLRREKPPSSAWDDGSASIRGMTVGWPCVARHERRLDGRDHATGRDRRRHRCRGGTCSTRGRCPRCRRPSCARVRAEYLATLGPDGAAEVEAELRARDERLAAAVAAERAGRAVVRARPLRPAPAAPDPRRAARPPGRRGADLHRLVPRPPGLRRPRRARARRAREPVAGAHAGDARARAHGARGVGRLPRARPARARPRAPPRRTRGCRYLAPALRRLLEELPGARDGLSRTERQLLAAVGARAPARASEAFLACMACRGGAVHRRHDRVRPPRRAAAARILVTTDRSRSPRTGATVLAGRADRVALLGFDRWLGGTAPARRGGRCGAGTPSEASLVGP